MNSPNHNGNRAAFPDPESPAGRSDRREELNLLFRRQRLEDQIPPEFKLLVAEVRNYLSGLRQWLDQTEAGWSKLPAAEAEAQQRDILDNMSRKIIEAFNVKHEQFEELAYQIPPELREVHQDYVRRHWQDLFLCTPFGHRTFYKPNGYAGDYEMMNMIHRNQPEGRTVYEKLIHFLLVSQWPALSVRNRIAYLQKRLDEEVARVVRAGRRARILNVGCGPAREAQYFLRDNRLSNEADFTLLDFNQETLDYASGQLNGLKQKHDRQTGVATINASVLELMHRAVRHGSAGLGEKYDFIYCSGLFDYLTEEVCTELTGLFYRSLLPGGLVVVANMHDCKPFRYCVEFLLDWMLFYRPAHVVRQFAPPGTGEDAKVISEDCGVTLFLQVRQPD